MMKILYLVVLFVSFSGCVTSAPKTYNAAGLSDEKLVTIVCKKRDDFLDPNFDADIGAVYDESHQKISGSSDCSDSLELGHKFQPGKYLFVVLCSQGSAAYAYPQVAVELIESRTYLITCFTHNKEGLFGIEFLDKASATITELN